MSESEAHHRLDPTPDLPVDHDVFVHGYVRHQGGDSYWVAPYWRRPPGSEGKPYTPEQKKRVLDRLDAMEKELTFEYNYNEGQMEQDKQKEEDLPPWDLPDKQVLENEIDSDARTVQEDRDALTHIRQLRAEWSKK